MNKTLLSVIRDGSKNPEAYPPLLSTEDAVRDFLAQHFAGAMIAHPECQDVLEKLYEDITGMKRERGWVKKP